MPTRVIDTVCERARLMSDPLRSSPMARRPLDAEAVLERISDGCVVLDHEYRFIYANPAGLRDMRKTLDEILGRVHWDVFPASFHITAGQRYRAALETGVPQHFTEHYCYEGLDLHMEMSAYPTERGGVAVFWKDISDRVRAEQQVRASESLAHDRFAELEQVYRYAPVGLCTVDRELRYTRVNERLAELNGHPAADHIGRFVWEMVPDLADESTRNMREVLETGVPAIDRPISGTTAAQPGVRRHWLASLYPLRASDGAIVGVISAVLEVTGYVQAEAQLRDSEARSRVLFRDAPVPMFLFDAASLRFLDVNAEAVRVYGFTADEFLRMTLRDIRPPEDQAHLDAALSANSPTDISHTSARHWRKDGSIMHVEVATQLTEYQGRPARVVMVVDVTERRRAEAIQRELEERLRQSQKMEAIGQLAGGIAHDFNNLLTVIVGNLDFVSHGLADDAAVRPDLDEIAAAAERARTLVRQLLTFSRKQRVQPALVQVGDVVRGMERLLRRVIGEEISMDVRVDADAGAVQIDPGQLEQVVMNLVVNARHALLTPAHGHEGTGGALSIEVSRQRGPARDGQAGGEWVAVCVRDTGHGMDAHTREHLFEPFFTTKDVGVGTGLGLATVHGIVQQAGGQIDVESAPGQGTTFLIRFPLAVSPVTPASTTAGPDRPSLRGTTVLIAEDEAPVRTILRRMLEHHGARVLEARHGRDAMALWADHRSHVDVIVTDLRMPELGGRELVAQLRAGGAAVRAVFLSGYADGALQGSLGPNDQFVEKPFTADALLGAVQRVVGEPLAPVTAPPAPH